MINNNSEADYFMNAKRKLRLVLSTSDCHACDVRNNSVSSLSLIHEEVVTLTLFRPQRCHHC